MVRLERLLANRGYCARSAAGKFLAAHSVRVAGKPLRKPDERVDERAVTIDNEPIDPETVVLLMNKPLGLTCSHDDKPPLVYDLLPERYRRRDPAIATVGRLDKETTGTLLLTDDGQLLHKLTSPKHHHPRTYHVTLDRDMSGSEGELFASGKMMLESDPKPLLPARLEVLSAREAKLVLTEGRYHQVRRMFAATGNHVTALHRDTFGPLSAASLSVGEWRHLAPEELASLLTPN